MRARRTMLGLIVRRLGAPIAAAIALLLLAGASCDASRPAREMAERCQVGDIVTVPSPGLTIEGPNERETLIPAGSWQIVETLAHYERREAYLVKRPAAKLLVERVVGERRRVTVVTVWRDALGETGLCPGSRRSPGPTN